ncbi:MAG: Crp/Fnr family transcriptional regulator [Bdellovibrio sp.]|nr:Crp/Fnr family transcriptional regulator [Bdellovibrio sp.]
MTDTLNRLKNLDCFKPMSERDLKEISSQFEVVYVKQRDILFKEDTAIKDLYIVLYGSFKIQKKVHRSTPVILNFLGRGEFLGIAMAGITVPKYPASAVANEDGALLRFDRNFFLNTLMKMESVKTVVNQQMGERFLEFQNDRCMEKARIPQKIADFLLRMCRRQKNNSGQIQIPITRKEIAQRVGTHTETVIRVLSLWTKNGWIRTEDKHIELLAIHEIERSCGPMNIPLELEVDSK